MLFKKSLEKKEKLKVCKIHGSPFVISIMIVLSIWSLFTLYLIFWGVMTAFKSIDQFMDNPVWIVEYLPWKWEWNNFIYVLQNFYVEVSSVNGTKTVELFELVINSILYSVVPPVIKMFVTTWVAYLIQRYDYKFSRFLEIFILTIMFIPIGGGGSSLLALLRLTGLFDTFWSIYLQNFTFVWMGFLIMIGIFRQLPKDYDDAARIDGASQMRIFTSVMLPFVFPIMLTYIVQGFIGAWNDYMTPLVYLPTHPTVANAIYRMSISNIQGFSRTPMRMMTCAFMVIPMVIVFLTLRNKIMGKMTAGGLKG